MRQLTISQSITQRECRSLEKYFNEVDRICLLTPEQEVILARKILARDRSALESLIAGNLRFVISVAKQYQFQALIPGDLINEGNIGLMIAAERYDETKGFKFISYAVWWIRQFIISAISRHARIIRLPYNQLRLLSKLCKALSELEQEYGRKPSLEELSSCLEIPVKMVAELFHKHGTQVSIDEPFSPVGNHSLLEVLPSDEYRTDDNVLSDSVRREIQYSLEFLSSRERELLILFFGLENNSPITIKEIGKRFNITKEHAGRIKTKALAKLRNCSRSGMLLSCLA